MKLKILLILATGLVILGCGFKNEFVHVQTKPVKYADEIVLTNGIVTLGISPSVGRIVSFAKVGGGDLLWRNLDSKINKQKRDSSQWVNYGGDKIWPTLQPFWPRIYGFSKCFLPDQDIDGGKWRVLEQGKTRIVIESPPSARLNVNIRREIILADGKALVTIKNTLKQLSASPFPVCIWTITQVKPPQYCLLDIAKKRPEAKRFVDFYNIKAKAKAQMLRGETILKVFPKSKIKTKVGTFGRWIAAVYQDCIFRQSTDYDSSGCYPDNASMECYWNNKAVNPDQQLWSSNYVELELLGKTVHLQPGEQISNVVQWEIIDRLKKQDIIDTLITH